MNLTSDEMGVGVGDGWIWCVGAEHGWRKWSLEFLAGLGKPHAPAVGTESLGCELQAGKRRRGVPRVLGHLVMTHISFWAHFLPGCL